jgi:PEP-CTERM motif
MMRKLVLVGTLGAIFLDAAAAFAGTPQPRPIPNPGTLLLLTSGLAGLAWWLRKRD